MNVRVHYCRFRDVDTTVILIKFAFHVELFFCSILIYFITKQLLFVMLVLTTYFMTYFPAPISSIVSRV